MWTGPPRNPNLLCWHKSLYFIDHGAALYFHHDWRDIAGKVHSRFPAIRDHVLLPWARDIEGVDAILRSRLTPAVFAGILDQVPDAWLLREPGLPTPAEKRAGYVEYFTARLVGAASFIEEAMNARARFL